LPTRATFHAAVVAPAALATAVLASKDYEPIEEYRLDPYVHVHLFGIDLSANWPFFVVNAFLALVVAWQAHRRGRPFIGYFVFGFLLTAIFAAVVLAGYEWRARRRTKR
jgi:hypothetical protein